MKKFVSWPRGRDPVLEHRRFVHCAGREGRVHGHRARQASGFGHERMRSFSSAGFYFLISHEECPRLMVTSNY